MDYLAYWEATLAQRAEEMAAYFAPGAEVCWPCTGERFPAETFIAVNCAYPGAWEGETERVVPLPSGAVTVTRIVSKAGDYSCHAVSFFTVENGKITALTEYYADDGPPPAWRTALLNK